MKKLDFTKVYNVIGKILCGIAGGIIGLVTGGLYWAIPGIILGVIIGHFIEKRIAKPALNKK